jgi:hypothetical protein
MIPKPTITATPPAAPAKNKVIDEENFHHVYIMTKKVVVN